MQQSSGADELLVRLGTDAVVERFRKPGETAARGASVNPARYASEALPSWLRTQRRSTSQRPEDPQLAKLFQRIARRSPLAGPGFRLPVGGRDRERDFTDAVSGVDAGVNLSRVVNCAAKLLHLLAERALLSHSDPPVEGDSRLRSGLSKENRDPGFPCGKTSWEFGGRRRSSGDDFLHTAQC
jgi:hypothetical protein